MKRLILLFATTLLSLTSYATEHDYQVGNIHITQPWSRELPAVAPTLPVYFQLDNQGDQDDQLLSAVTPIAGRAELHEHVHANGTMKMQQVASVTIAAHTQVSFAPMGYHIMLFEVQQHPQAGQSFPVTLHFARSGDVQIDVTVQKEAAHEGHVH